MCTKWIKLYNKDQKINMVQSWFKDIKIFWSVLLYDEDKYYHNSVYEPKVNHTWETKEIIKKNFTKLKPD